MRVECLFQFTMKFSFLILSACVLGQLSTASADWPQWRGPDRNGSADASSELPDQLTEENAPVKLWESAGIPSDKDGGHGSVAIADGQVFISVVWHRNEPTETRQIDKDVLSTLGHRGTTGLDPEIVEKMEADRIGLSSRTRGAALDEWANEWIESNLDKKTQLSLGSWIKSRFIKGQAAIPLSVFDTLLTAPKEPFANQKALEAWVELQNFEPALKAQILSAVPNTKKVADDVVLCLNAETGEQIWKFSNPGSPSGRSSSSTPAVADGRIYAALSDNLYCLDVSTGEEVWKAPLTGKKGPASSPLVYEGKVYLQQGVLSAFDTLTGEELWQNKDVSTSNPSPSLWEGVILCNSKGKLLGVDAYSGATLWSVPGGGDGTPVVSGDIVVISSSLEGKNLIGYRMTDTSPSEIWSLDFLARRYGSSPIIYDGHVYYLGSERHSCISLESGEIQWEREAQSSISSPLIADGKLLVYENKGGFAAIIEATPEEYRNLGKTKIGALFCASPALVGRDLFLRTTESIACYRFP